MGPRHTPEPRASTDARGTSARVFPAIFPAGILSQLATPLWTGTSAMVWQKPERLLPPRIVDALLAVHAGDAARALQLLGSSERDDALTADVVRLVRGLAAAESGERPRARSLLRPLLAHADVSIALAATLASVEMRMQQRSFAGAIPWLSRLRRHVSDEPTKLVLDASLLRLRLRRGVLVTPAEVERLQQRLLRRHPAAVHATLHLLACERALYAGELAAAAGAARAAHPYVSSSQLAALRRWHQAMAGLLHGAPVALVEDWRRPWRAMSRAELGDLEREPWQLWVDLRRMQLLERRSMRAEERAVHFAAVPEVWEVWKLLVTAPSRRLEWAALQRALALPEPAAARERAAALQAHLAARDAARLLRLGSRGCSLTARRFVHLHAPEPLHPTQARLLGELSEHPGSRSQELARALRLPRRTALRHLHALRTRALVLMAGGGAEARYWAI